MTDKSTSPCEGPFTLRVNISGVALYVFDAREPRARVAVVIPDARSSTRNPDVRRRDGRPTHLDGSTAEPHAGFLRVNLAHFVDPKQAGRVGDPGKPPEFEILHRFDGESVEIVGLAENASPVRWETNEESRVPDLARFAPHLEPDAAIFLPVPAKSVLARMDLYGGTLRVSKSAVKWKIGAETPLTGAFGRTVTWEREISGDHVRVRLTPFDAAGTARELVLYPTRGPDDVCRVTLDVANLCKVNPLGWDELAEPQSAPPRDVDFKWLYRLLRPKDLDAARACFYAPLPIPEPIEVSTAAEGDLDGCTGTRTSADIEALIAAASAASRDAG